MNKLFRILVMLLITTGVVLADAPGPKKFEEPMKVLLKAYSDGDFRALHQRFTTKLGSSLSLDALAEMLAKMKAYYGPADGYKFISVDHDVAVYRLSSKRRPLEVKMEVDGHGQIAGFTLTAARRVAVYPELKRNRTKMSLPVKDEWFVIWGGDKPEQNYHMARKFQKYATDFFQVGPDGRSYKGEGKVNEDYYAFGKDVIAPCDGEITDVVDGVRDNIPGDVNQFYPAGNSLMMKTANKEYIFFCHFKQNSIQVKAGQKVERGQVLGQCGNSGSTPEPHLHFHIQNTDDTLNATGAKCFFEKLILVKPEKVEEIKDDYMPVRGDRVKEYKP